MNSAQMDTMRDLDMNAECEAAHWEAEALEAAGRRMREAGAAAATQCSIDAAREDYHRAFGHGTAQDIQRTGAKLDQMTTRAYAEQADAELAMAKGD